MTLCKQEGIFINRPEIEPPVDGCVYAMSVRIGIVEYGETVYYDGQSVMYVIYVENTGTCDLENITLTDETSENTWNISALAEGEIYEVYSEHVITGEDIEQEGAFLFVTADCAEAHAQTHQTVYVPSAKNDISGNIWADTEGDWQVGDNIPINVGVYNVGNTNVWDLILYISDGSREEEFTIPFMSPRQTEHFQIIHTVTASDHYGFSVDAVFVWVDIDNTVWSERIIRTFTID